MSGSSSSESGKSLNEVQAESYASSSEVLAQSYPSSHAMNDQELSEFLCRKKYAVLATPRPDGKAHATPIGFLLFQNSFWIASVEGRRLRNLRRRRWASLVVMEGEPPTRHRAVIAEGPVVLHEGQDKSTILCDREFLSAWEMKLRNKGEWAAALIELRPERLFSYDSEKK